LLPLNVAAAVQAAQTKRNELFDDTPHGNAAVAVEINPVLDMQGISGESVSAAQLLGDDTSDAEDD
jgi:hypothetical protein